MSLLMESVVLITCLSDIGIDIGIDIDIDIGIDIDIDIGIDIDIDGMWGANEYEWRKRMFGLGLLIVNIENIHIHIHIHIHDHDVLYTYPQWISTPKYAVLALRASLALTQSSKRSSDTSSPSPPSPLECRTCG